MAKPNRRSFSAADLVVVERASHEEIIAGDFVRLASGGPIGLATSVDAEHAEVVWFNKGRYHSMLPWVCLRVVRA